MAGHALLPGCQVPWRHDDCPARLPSPPRGDGEPALGGVVCHCPCHGLRREVTRLRGEVAAYAASLAIFEDPELVVALTHPVPDPHEREA